MVYSRKGKESEKSSSCQFVLCGQTTNQTMSQTKRFICKSNRFVVCGLANPGPQTGFAESPKKQLSDRVPAPASQLFLHLSGQEA